MITADEAWQQAENHINGTKAPEDRYEVGILEFDEGYVVWRVEPEPEDLSKPPPVIGTGCSVIDKETGELTTWPSAPVDMVAENYRRSRQGLELVWGEPG